MTATGGFDGLPVAGVAAATSDAPKDAGVVVVLGDLATFEMDTAKKAPSGAGHGASDLAITAKDPVLRLPNRLLPVGSATGGLAGEGFHLGSTKRGPSSTPNLAAGSLRWNARGFVCLLRHRQGRPWVSSLKSYTYP